MELCETASRKLSLFCYQWELFIGWEAGVTLHIALTKCDLHCCTVKYSVGLHYKYFLTNISVVGFRSVTAVERVFFGKGWSLLPTAMTLMACASLHKPRRQWTSSLESLLTASATSVEIIPVNPFPLIILCLIHNFPSLLFFIHYVALIRFLCDLSKLYFIKLVLYQIHNLKGCCLCLKYKHKEIQGVSDLL